MRLFTLLCFLSVSPLFQKLEAQEHALPISGNYQELSFDDFAVLVQDQCGINLYYRESWVEELKVSVMGSGLPLLPILDSILHPMGLNYFLDEWNHLFLTDTAILLANLPAYHSIRDSPETAGKEVRAPELTLAEQKYINGRKIRVPEIVHVGSEELAAEGKKALIHGTISDLDSGEPLVGATLYIEELKKGSSTNSDGLFNLVIPPGSYQAECNSMGMEALQFTLVVHSHGDLALSMKRILIPLDEVVIRADKYPHVSGSQMGFERLNYQVLKEVPLVMGERDIINVVKMLPGVQSVGEGASGFNVRGSAVDQNMIYINKVPVYNSSHLFGFFSSFSPEIVSDFTLFKSNLPASFGGRLASFFDIQSKQGNNKRFVARGGISSISAYAAAEGPIRKGKSSFLLSARSTYSDWILNLMEDPLLRNSEAGFQDFSGVLTMVPSDRTRVRAFTYLSRDRFSLGTKNEYSYGNTGGAVDVRHRFNQRITGNLALIYSRYQFRNSDIQELSAGYEHAYHIDHYEIKSDFTWLSLGKHTMSFGSSTIYYRLNRGSINPYGKISLREPLDLGMENGVETALYAADEISLSDRLSVYGGLRISAFFSLGPGSVRTYYAGMPKLEDNVSDTLDFGSGEVTRSFFGLEPRLNLRYMLNDRSSVKFSYNRGYQYLFMLSNTVAIGPSDQWKLCDYHIPPQYLDQLSAGYYRDLPGSGFKTSVELYRKWGHQMVEYRDGASFVDGLYVESEILIGEQRAWGIESMIRKKSGALRGWLSYTYSRVFMQVDGTGGEHINNGKPFPSVFDRPHSLALVVNYKQGRRLSFSSNLVYITGRPVTYPVSIYYEYDLPYIHYSDRNRYRIPDYFRLDFSLNLEGTLKKDKKFHSYWMLSVYNLTGRKNAYSVYFKNQSNYIKGYKLSIFGQPIFTLSWNVKLGNYASE